MLSEWLNVWIYLSIVMLNGVKSARPRFDTSTDMGLVLVPADAEVESVIFRLRATDQDADFPLIFDIIATVNPIVRIENLPCTLYNKVCQANVILTKRLTAGRLHDFAVRVKDSKGDYNSMQATISVTNATTQRDLIFPHIPALIMVPENAKPGTELDYILVKSNPWSGKPVYVELWQPKELFTIRQRQTPSSTQGMIILIGELDFETQSMYTLTIYATDPYTEPKKDTRNIAGLHLVVIVQDVQDVAPIFTLAPPITKINNSVQVGDIVVRVHAEDGDKGVPREIVYGLVPDNKPLTSFFNISMNTGEIALARPLEELTQITHVGAPVVLSVVAEEIRKSTDEPPAQASIVEVGLLLGEPGNNPPYFENQSYMAWMDENAEPGTSVVFTEPYSTRVRDEDIGKAGVFALKLEHNNGTFEISPTVAERTTNFVITVRDKTLLDYEINKSLYFEILAQEVGPATNLSALVPVMIMLRDINDNPPEFDQDFYEITLSENVTIGTRVVQVHATDKDTGSFGKIKYSKITGTGSEAFTINSETGVITVTRGSILDREITPQLQLIIEATDDDGRGLKGTVPLTVNLLDVNDNAPIFEKDVYQFTLNPDLTNFSTPAIIKAFDADAEPPNNEVRYELIHGNYENKFYLDEKTGELFIREQITKIRNTRHNSPQQFVTKFKKKVVQLASDKITSTLKPTLLMNTSHNNDTNVINKTDEVMRKKREDKDVLFTLTARAYDLGVPHLSETVEVKILPSPLAGIRTVMFLVPGEHPDPTKTAQTLATITGGRITVQEIRPYTPGSLPNGSDLPNSTTGKKSIVVAKVEQIGSGASFVDVEKIKAALAANGVDVIDGDMTNGNTGTKNDNTNVNVNKTITTVHSEEVTVYKAENQLLFWLLIILGLLILAAIITLVICCICPSCPFYMAPRKRRIHSSETLVARSDGRPQRHLYRRHPPTIEFSSEKKQAWSADPARMNWQFNRRNVKNFGIASLPGDVHRIEDKYHDLPPKASSLHLRHSSMYSKEPVFCRNEDQMYVEDVDGSRMRVYDGPDVDLIRQREMERTAEINRQVYNRMEPQLDERNRLRDQHYYREGNAEVMRLVTRGNLEETTVTMHPQPEIVIDQASIHRDGKDILLRRFIEDQKDRIISQDYHESLQELERQSMESHHRQRQVLLQQQQQQQQEILLIPERLDKQDHRQISEEVGPDIQRLIIDHGSRPNETQDFIPGTLLIAAPMPKVSDKSKEQVKRPGNLQHYSIQNLELARQNVLLTRLLLEKDRGVGGIAVDSSSYLETQSLPGQVAIGTQTNQTTGTQTEQTLYLRSRSDNDESEEDARMRRKLKSKKRYGENEPRRIRTLWMKSPIREEDLSYSECNSALKRKMKDIKDGRKISIEPQVLREISDSLDETGDNLVGNEQQSSNSREDDILRREESSSVDVNKRESKVFCKVSEEECKKKKKKDYSTSDSREAVKEKRELTEPSFRILEREMSSLSRKLSRLTGKKVSESEDDNHETEKLIKGDLKREEVKVGSKEMKKINKIETSKSKKLKRDSKISQSSVKDQSKSLEETSSDKSQSSKYSKKITTSTASSELEEASEKAKKLVKLRKKESDNEIKQSTHRLPSKLQRQPAVEHKEFKMPMKNQMISSSRWKDSLTKSLKSDSTSKKSDSDSEGMKKSSGEQSANEKLPYVNRKYGRKAEIMKESSSSFENAKEHLKIEKPPPKKHSVGTLIETQQPIPNEKQQSVDKKIPSDDSMLKTEDSSTFDDELKGKETKDGREEMRVINWSLKHQVDKPERISIKYPGEIIQSAASVINVIEKTASGSSEMTGTTVEKSEDERIIGEEIKKLEKPDGFKFKFKEEEVEKTVEEAVEEFKKEKEELKEKENEEIENKVMESIDAKKPLERMDKVSEEIISTIFKQRDDIRDEKVVETLGTEKESLILKEESLIEDNKENIESLPVTPSSKVDVVSEKGSTKDLDSFIPSPIKIEPEKESASVIDVDLLSRKLEEELRISIKAPTVDTAESIEETVDEGDLGKDSDKVLSGQLTPVSVVSSRSPKKVVVISRETSFLNSPRRLSAEDYLPSKKESPRETDELIPDVGNETVEKGELIKSDDTVSNELISDAAKDVQQKDEAITSDKLALEDVDSTDKLIPQAETQKKHEVIEIDALVLKKVDSTDKLSSDEVKREVDAWQKNEAVGSEEFILKEVESADTLLFTGGEETQQENEATERDELIKTDTLISKESKCADHLSALDKNEVQQKSEAIEGDELISKPPESTDKSTLDDGDKIKRTDSKDIKSEELILTEIKIDKLTFDDEDETQREEQEEIKRDEPISKDIDMKDEELKIESVDKLVLDDGQHIQMKEEEIKSVEMICKEDATTEKSDEHLEPMPISVAGKFDDSLDIFLEDDDSDASSDSSTQTAYTARPYGTPRHRRLIRTENFEDNDPEESNPQTIDTDFEKTTEEVKPLKVQLEKGVRDVEDFEEETKESEILKDLKTDEVEKLDQKDGENVQQVEDLKSPNETLDDSTSKSSENQLLVDEEVGDEIPTLLKQSNDTLENVEGIKVAKDSALETKTEAKDEIPKSSDTGEDFIDDKVEVGSEESETKTLDDEKEEDNEKRMDVGGDNFEVKTSKEETEKVESFFHSNETINVGDLTSLEDQRKILDSDDGKEEQMGGKKDIKFENESPGLDCKFQITSSTNEKIISQAEDNDSSKLNEEITKENVVKDKLKGFERIARPVKVKLPVKKDKKVGQIQREIIDAQPGKSTKTERTEISHQQLDEESKSKKDRTRPRIDDKEMQHQEVMVLKKSKKLSSREVEKLISRLSTKVIIQEDQQEQQQKVLSEENLSVMKKERRKMYEKMSRLGLPKKSSSSEGEKEDEKFRDKIQDKSPISKVKKTLGLIEKSSNKKDVQPRDLPIKTEDKLPSKVKEISEKSSTKVDETIEKVIEEEVGSANKSLEILVNQDNDNTLIKSDITSESTVLEETREDKKDKMEFNKPVTPRKTSKHMKEEHSEAQSRYMEWYKQNREEMERRKQERREQIIESNEDTPPKWLRKSNRQRWLKMTPEDRQLFDLKAPNILQPSRRPIKPLVNIESEQLKAIVRQGRKMMKAEGDCYDPPVEIFAPKKSKNHYLIQHSEYKYERLPPPFYLHPPPVPHSSPQLSPHQVDYQPPEETYPCPVESQSLEDVDTPGIPVPLNRLRHQQLLEKKSVFDIAYNEAAPSHLRSDSTSPPS